MIGGLGLGIISDKLYGKRGPVAFVALIFANITVYLIAFGNKSISKAVFFMLMFFFGMFLSGLNNLV